ncbi:phytoene desaturase family protein [Lichenicoccus sp.]|uniref:phytoene desaturase family protein n=1 Tax=Lichenicoccus sp. TaxID=2781899 RepID=UPI003D0A3F23
MRWRTHPAVLQSVPPLPDAWPGAAPDAVEDALVVGAGLGGIAVALRLRALGYRVTILERCRQPGGRARVFSQDGYIFDAGPTVITAPYLFEELFELFGERLADHVDLLAVRPWYRITFPDRRHFDYGGTGRGMEAEVEAFAPGNGAGYRRLARRARQLFEVGYERYGGTSFDRWQTMLRAFPAIIRLGGLRSLHALVRRHIRSPELQRAFTLQTLLIGGHPYRTSAIYALIQHLEQRWGVWFARGGTGALVAALLALAARHGVALRTATTVSRIVVERGTVRGVVLDDGSMLAASVVVANADAPYVHRHLLGRREGWRRWRYSMGLYVLYFGTDRQWPATAHHTIILGEDYKALLDEIFDGSAGLPDDPSLYLHRPGATDPSLAPPGCDGFYVLAPVPNLQSSIDWERMEPAFRERILSILEARELPGLRAHITTLRCITPRDFARDLLSTHGAGFSVAPSLLQSAGFRFHNRVRRAEGLYLVGAGTHPGAGVPGVLCSAKVVQSLLEAERAGSLRNRRARPGARPRRSARQPGGSALSTLARHGRSFRLAGTLLRRRDLEDAATLYAFCRQVDDLADLADDPDVARGALLDLRHAVAASDARHVRAAPLLEIAGRRDIDLHPALALIDTMILDLAPLAVADEAALLRYAYGAAGTVGLMMYDMLGLRDAAGRRYAVDLGIAMQLTNIARDVVEDAARGRLYLPAAWLPADLSVQGIALTQNAAAVYRAVQRLLALADRHYRSAEAGMKFLPSRPRAAIRVAARLYEEIGRMIVDAGAGYLAAGRVRVPTSRRLLLLARVVCGPQPAGKAADALIDTYVAVHELQ